MKKSINSLLITQGVYYFVTGLWPLVFLNGFLVVTGSAADLWRVKTVSLLILFIGLALLKGSAQKNNNQVINLLSVVSAFLLLFIDLYSLLNGAVSKIYMIDGFVQFTCIFFWLCIVIKRPVSLQRFKYL